MSEKVTSEKVESVGTVTPNGEEYDVDSNGEEKHQRHPLLVKRHIQYFKRVLGVLPGSMSSLDTNRMTLAFFAINGLDVLGAIDLISPKEKQEIIEWIYAQQILSGEDGETVNCGFRGSSFIGVPFEATTPPTQVPYDTGHIAMNYTALACLLILGDDLSRVNKPAILAGLRKMQLPSGSFCSIAEGSENDMRFVYCAACVCYMLNDWSTVDIDKMVAFIKSSQGFDGGIGQATFLESSGGSTYCGVAALSLMGKLDTTFSSTDLEELKKWCLLRQQTGFQGRPNKPTDTCYSFWIGASLKLLGASQFVNKEWNRRYIISTQGNYGGFSKWVDHHPDPLHTYLGLSGLSLNGEEGLEPIYPKLNISQRAAKWLDEIHKAS